MLPTPKRGGSHPVEVNLCLRITPQITFQLTGHLPTLLTNAYSTFDLVQQSTPRPAYADTPKAKLTRRRRNLTGVTIRIIIFNFKLFTPRLRRLWQPDTGYPDTLQTFAMIADLLYLIPWPTSVPCLIFIWLLSVWLLHQEFLYLERSQVFSQYRRCNAFRVTEPLNRNKEM